MTQQPDLFLPAVATVRGRQGELFETGGRVVNLTCQECGRPMETTPSGYLCCPRGCGKLLLAVPEDEPCGSWFDPETWEG